jgi:hypothetical protein
MKYQIIKGKYIGKTGYIEKTKSEDNIMFYPDDKIPYRVVIAKTDIKEIAE